MLETFLLGNPFDMLLKLDILNQNMRTIQPNSQLESYTPVIHVSYRLSLRWKYLTY